GVSTENSSPQSVCFQPFTFANAGDTSTVSAPASISALRGSVISDCSKPSVTRIATRLPLSVCSMVFSFRVWSSSRGVASGGAGLGGARRRARRLRQRRAGLGDDAAGAVGEVARGRAERIGRNVRGVDRFVAGEGAPAASPLRIEQVHDERSDGEAAEPGEEATASASLTEMTHFAPPSSWNPRKGARGTRPDDAE